jgi:hypothetical protein
MEVSRLPTRDSDNPFISSLGFVRQILSFKAVSIWLAWIASASLFAQAPVDLRAELAARRIELASQQIERIKALVDAGIEARIRLDAAERNLEDTKDQAIIDGAVLPPLANPAGPSEDATVAAAQRRLDRQKAWMEKIRELTENGVVPPSDVIATETELHSRESDLLSAQARVFAKVEAAASAARSLHKDETTPLDFDDGEMEHYEGLGTFDEARDLQDLVKAFGAEFGHPLPISADGETEVHRALGFDHRGRVDVAIHPLAPEGVWLRRYLRSRQIPYYAFTSAIVGKATAAHIHIGPGSTRLLRPSGKS